MSDIKVVFRFIKYDSDTDEEPTSRRYATMECVERIIQGVVVKDSLRTVPAECVDARGFYVGPRLDPG
jgi:hypothetical protein